jgi:hypothetical protein
VFDQVNFVRACKDIENDITIILFRRGQRISASHPSQSKIAGIIAFRLAKSHIIHLSKEVIDCKVRCMADLNIRMAIECAFNYVNNDYLRVDQELRRELLYTMTSRHMNQETLGLVFEAILSKTKK